MEKLETRVDEIAARIDGVMGVAFLDLTGGQILLHNAGRVFPPPASSIKIAILLELYRQNQEALPSAPLAKSLSKRTATSKCAAKPLSMAGYSYRPETEFTKLAVVKGDRQVAAATAPRYHSN